MGLRIAVIGCGIRGIDSALSIRRARNVSLEVVMDTEESRARTVGQNLEVRWTTEYASVLDDDRVDAVLISTPHHLHAPLATAAAAAGKHAIVEKPLAHQLRAAVEMVQAFIEAGVTLSPWLGFRYLPEIVKARELIEGGALGSLLGAHLVHHLAKPLHYFYRLGEPTWQARWDSAGGGVLITLAIHYLDWLLYLAESRVEEVSARFSTLDGDVEVEDTLVMWMRFENGALATLNASSRVQGLYRPDQTLTEFRMWGTEGHLSLTPPPQFYSSRLVNGKRPERWHDLAPLPKLQPPEVEFLERFAAAIEGEQEPEISAADGLRVQAVIEAAYQSGRTGRPVAVENWG
jgi:predicted dehydrogenase